MKTAVLLSYRLAPIVPEPRAFWPALNLSEFESALAWCGY